MRKPVPTERPVLHAPPPPSPSEMDRLERGREQADGAPKPKRGTVVVDFYI